jgi:hypothetical protein
MKVIKIFPGKKRHIKLTVKNTNNGI